jgi:hypothetical protein
MDQPHPRQCTNSSIAQDVTRLWASPTSTMAGNLRYSRVLKFFSTIDGDIAAGH